MTDVLVQLRRDFGDLDVWCEAGGGVFVQWAQPTDESRAFPLSLDFTAAEVDQIIAARTEATR
jgi:hypothetical protein